jgi:hypothetical protein
MVVSRALGFDGCPLELAPGESKTLHGRPQCLFKPRQLVPARRYPGVYLIDVKIGFLSQLAAPDGLPLEAFHVGTAIEDLIKRLDAGKISAADAGKMIELKREIVELRDNFVLPTVQIGQDFPIHLTNKGREKVLIELYVRGLSVIDGPLTPEQLHQLQRHGELTIIEAAE